MIGDLYDTFQTPGRLTRLRWRWMGPPARIEDLIQPEETP